MSENIDLNGPLPPGWESRYDNRAKKYYYVDNYNRTTTWDDPRPRYRGLLLQQSRQGSPSHSLIGTGEMIPLQHGSLELRGSSTVYPSYSSYPPPPQPAFQLPPTPFSHLAPNSSLYQDFSVSGRPSPILSRAIGTVMGSNAFQHRSQNNIETSLSANTDELVAKIGATFPTVPDAHIRSLLKKYHNREAVVISALQVEKHPITAPGPFSTPPLARNLYLSGAYTPIMMTPPVSARGTPTPGLRSNISGTSVRGVLATPPMTVRSSPPTRGSSPGPRASSAGSSYFGSPRFGDYRQSPRPQSSPKMKLRYLKNVFPKAEETLLLDLLASEDNNVMKAMEKLKTMGFEKRDSSSKHSSKVREEEEIRRELEKTEETKPTPPPRLKSLEEKDRMKNRLQGLYSDIPERLIQIAIESADFDEEKARQILMLMVHEEKENRLVTDSGLVFGGSGADLTDSVSKATLAVEAGTSMDKKVSPRKSASPGEKGDNSNKEKNKLPKVSRGTSTTEDREFRSPLVSKPQGRNSALRKGPNDQLLLVDYITWSGPNGELRGKTGSQAKGPSKTAPSEKRFLAKGPSKDMRNGPNIGLAKGSIYSHLTGKIESRGQ